METPDRRTFLKSGVAAAATVMASEALAQPESTAPVTLSRLEFSALRFGINRDWLDQLLSLGTKFDFNSDDRKVSIDLWGKRLTLSEWDKVVLIGFAAMEGDRRTVTFTIADPKSARRFIFEN